MQTYISKSVTETKNLAKKLAKNFKGGEILGLIGDLGSGKTHFTKGLAEFYKIKKTITSPTFVLLKPYSIPRDPSSRRSRAAGFKTGLKNLIHIDCYRLDKPNQLLEIGLEEYINNPESVVVIEWAEKIKNILPKNTIYINFKLGKKENKRIIQIISN